MNNPSLSTLAPQKASFWKRLVAFLIDKVLISTIGFLIAKLSGLPAVLSLVSFLLFHSYGTIAEHYRQATLGKLCMKLKVVGIDGQPPTLINSFNRNFGKIISAIPLFYGFFRILAPHHLQTIHDSIGRCVVIDISGTK